MQLIKSIGPKGDVKYDAHCNDKFSYTELEVLKIRLMVKNIIKQLKDWILPISINSKFF